MDVSADVERNTISEPNIQTLDGFLLSKNREASANPYWSPADFERHVYPYFDIFHLEKGTRGDSAYRPTLASITATEEPDLYMCKLVFDGLDSTGTLRIKTINKSLLFELLGNGSNDGAHWHSLAQLGIDRANMYTEFRDELLRAPTEILR